MLRPVLLIALVLSFPTWAFARQPPGGIQNPPETNARGSHIAARPATPHHRKTMAHHQHPKAQARKPKHNHARARNMPRIITPEGNVLRVNVRDTDVKVIR
jgi:hypothetical protein